MKIFLRTGGLALMLFMTACGGVNASRAVAVPAQNAAALPDQRLVRNAMLGLSVPHEPEIRPVLESARKLATDADGYISSESSTSLTMRVPNDRLENVIDSLSTMAKVGYKNISANDVGAEYTDLTIRIDNARSLEAGLRELLKKAVTVQDILEVERELNRVTTELEQLEARQRRLENQTAFATLNLSVQQHARPGPVGWIFYGLYKGVEWLLVWN